ncbi:putative glutathione transferase [Helianthus annuus]|nr:putative glutathione transferase [Helianthus annuus]KAJ0828916.1 putative glutathione transferase [Helianthus annuus]KAJ0959319.1 putative glutathione transferase [Helianthus annuus]
MAIKLYGIVGSTATLRVKACLAEKEIDYEFVNINMSNKEHKTPEFLSRNICIPFGQVPTLEDGDLKLFGTNYNCLWMDFSFLLIYGSVLSSDGAKNKISVFGFLKTLRVCISQF